jgi:hypothetical protein
MGLRVKAQSWFLHSSHILTHLNFQDIYVTVLTSSSSTVHFLCSQLLSDDNEVQGLALYCIVLYLPMLQVDGQS